MKKPTQEVSLLPLLDIACGLDIHKEKIVGFISDKGGKCQTLQEFGTFTEQLHQIKDWLLQHKVKHCLMESTGIYWMSLYAILTGAGIEVVVANPAHIKQIPKRKTDRRDARWLCTLLLHGLVRPSFIPHTQQRMLRDYCRNRLFYQRQITRIQNRMLKVLEANNIKLRSVISSIDTKTGMNLVRMLAAGITDKARLLSCAEGSVIKKKDQLALALEGTLNRHHYIQLSMLLEDFDHIQGQIQRLNSAITTLISDHYAQVSECLHSISGIGDKTAQVIVGEIGDNMSRFPTADHLTAWCGVAPGNNESAGKRLNSGIKRGNTYLRVAIVHVAWAAVRTKDSYWNALFQHLRKRMKAQKAIIAIARRLLKVVYKTISTRVIYQEKGLTHFVDLQAKHIYRLKTQSISKG